MTSVAHSAGLFLFLPRCCGAHLHQSLKYPRLLGYCGSGTEELTHCFAYQPNPPNHPQYKAHKSLYLLPLKPWYSADNIRWMDRTSGPVAFLQHNDFHSRQRCLHLDKPSVFFAYCLHASNPESDGNSRLGRASALAALSHTNYCRQRVFLLLHITLPQHPQSRELRSDAGFCRGEVDLFIGFRPTCSLSGKQKSQVGLLPLLRGQPRH